MQYFLFDREGFLGAHPVTMRRKNLEYLSQKSYMVMEKADGKRFIMLIQGKDQVYILDRDNTVFQVRCYFHLKNSRCSKLLTVHNIHFS